MNYSFIIAYCIDIIIDDNGIHIEFDKDLSNNTNYNLVLVKSGDCVNVMYQRNKNSVTSPGIFLGDAEAFKNKYLGKLFFISLYHPSLNYPIEELWHYLGSLENPTIEEIDLIQSILNV